MKLVVGLGLLMGGYWLGFVHSEAYEKRETSPTLRRDRWSSEDALDDLVTNRTALRQPLDSSTFGFVPAPFITKPLDCSKPPAEGYPQKVPISEIVKNWNPDNPYDPPKQMYSSLCRFDYQKEYEMALLYRDAEVPFQLYNVPEMNEVARKWSDDNYIRRKLGSTKYKCEASNPGGEANHGANHFMYTNGRPLANKKEPPIKHVRLSWDEWLEKVDKNSNKSIDEPDSRFYFRFSSEGAGSWLFRELPFFQPKPTLFVREPKGQRGIHCRFGMAGVIAEAHWDGSRNMIAQFFGRRRYILVDPDDSCDMYLLAKNHPSGRHSAVDWSKPDSWASYPRFPGMLAHEVIQRPGDFLYLPTYYLHYIISLDRNYQCNTRSGRDDRQTDVVNKCTPGFVQTPGKRGQQRKRKFREGPAARTRA